jgi:hypothetical protein
MELIGLPFVTANSAPHATATLCYLPVVDFIALGKRAPEL